MKHKSLLFASVFLLSTFNLNAEMTPINKWQDACPFEEEVVVYTISPKTLLGENIRRDTFIIDIKNPNLFVGYIPNGLRSFFIGGETELLSYLATGLIKDGEIEMGYCLRMFLIKDSSNNAHTINDSNLESADLTMRVATPEELTKIISAIDAGKAEFDYMYSIIDRIRTLAASATK